MSLKGLQNIVEILLGCEVGERLELSMELSGIASVHLMCFLGITEAGSACKASQASATSQ